MGQITRVGGISRRASLIAAVGAVTALTAAAAVPPVKPHSSNGGLYLIGDSWAAGLHADPTRALGQIAAETLSMEARVDAISGTGYVNTAGHQNYLQRAKTASGAPRLVVVQGGSNDGSKSLEAIHQAATATYTTLRDRFPSARLLALGPGPDPEPVTNAQRAVDRTLDAAARSLGVAYVSMFEHLWIPDNRSDAVIDPTTHHPTVEGQAYLGLRLAAAVRLVHPGLLTVI